MTDNNVPNFELICGNGAYDISDQWLMYKCYTKNGFDNVLFTISGLGEYVGKNVKEKWVNDNKCDIRAYVKRTGYYPKTYPCYIIASHYHTFESGRPYYAIEYNKGRAYACLYNY